MGSIISLGVGRLEVDWGKNSFFTNHSNLFLPSDLKAAVYYYADNVRETRPAYVRRLESVTHRLELLGYTLEGCRTRFGDMATHLELGTPPLSFDDLANVLRHVDVDRQGLPGNPDDGYDPGEYVLETILQDPQFLKTLGAFTPQWDKWDQGLFFENLEPYVILRLLAENPATLTKPVIWRHMDVVENGWVAERDLFKHLVDGQRYLLVTEGSSDSHILQRSFEILKPDIADFFYFVDMSENYPFTGTGNIVRFCQGLAKIRIQNRVVVVLDNDAAGNAALSRLQALGLPRNMKAIVLPSLASFDAFPTVGPSGADVEPVNGKAVSVEMFLDLSHQTDDPAMVRWTSFDRSSGIYQGELVDKERYSNHFLTKGWRDRQYDKSKLEVLLAHIVTVASSLGESRQLEDS